MVIKLNLHPRSWNHKPSGKDVAWYIKKDMSNHLRELSPEELMVSIERGQVFTAGVLTGSTADTWKEQQLMCVDIDNGEHKTDKDGRRVFIPVDDPMTPEEALEVMSLYNIEPYFMYHTFSHEPEGIKHGVDKFRIVVILDKTIKDASIMKSYCKRLSLALNDIKPGVADTKVDNLDRLFFGSVPGSVFYISRSVTSLSSLDYLPREAEPQIRAIVRPSVSYSNNGKFDLLECLDYIDPDDRETWVKVGMALKYEGYSFDDWDMWACRSYKHDEKDSQRVWKSFNEGQNGRAITGAYITMLAKKCGYIPPSKRPRQTSNSISGDLF